MPKMSRRRIAAAVTLVTFMALNSMHASLVIAFGDSTTAPRDGVRIYSQILEDELQLGGGPVRVRNAGVPGNTTRDARQRFVRDVLAHKPDIVILQFGINDSAVDVWKNPPAETSRVPIDEYQENLRHFIRESRAGGSRVVMMTPNRMHWTPKLIELYGKPPYDPASADGMNRILRQYVHAMTEVAGELGVELIDVHQSMDRLSDEESAGLLLDGMHPNDAGHRNVADRLLEHFRQQPAAADSQTQTPDAPH